MPVDLYGPPAPLDGLRQIADRHGLVLIEDACQAHGAKIGERKAGAMGVSATFSFYPTKNITTAEGGMVTTDDAEIAARVRSLRQHGATQRYHHEILGYNFRLTDIAAAHVLSLPVHPKLTDSDLDRIIQAVRKVAAGA